MYAAPVCSTTPALLVAPMAAVVPSADKATEVPKKSPVILLVLALPVLVLVGPSCRHSAPSPSTTWLVVDRDADPRNLGGHPGALFTVNPKTGAVEVFATSSKWKDPIDVVQDTDGSLLVLGYHEGGAGAIFGFRVGLIEGTVFSRRLAARSAAIAGA